MSHPTCCDRDVWTLPTLDLEPLTKDARAWVMQRIDNPADPADVALDAADVIDKQSRALVAAREARDVAAWTVAQQYHLRRGANMPGALGLQRVAWKKIRDRLNENQPAPTPGALEALPTLALVAARIVARIDAATEVRDTAVLELINAGWSNADIARQIGRDPSRISSLRYRENPAA